MGMTYDELSVFGRLRKISRCGPVGMFEKLSQEWSHLPAEVVAEKVKRFFYYYSCDLQTFIPAPSCWISRCAQDQSSQDDYADAVVPRGELLAR